MPTLLITHAKPSGPQCLQAGKQLVLPHLTALLRRLTPGARTPDPQDSLTPMHELLKAAAMGLPSADGLTPWAALQAHTLQLAQADTSWAWLTPCHWQVNADHVRMAAPADTHISEAESVTLMEAMRSYFAEDGITLHGLHAGNWLASGAVFGGLPTASLARAAGGSVDHWLPRDARAGTLRRLQNEMQMLLYTHPVNDDRSARRLLPVNSFWVSGTGSLPAGFNAAHLPAALATVREDLCAANEQDDAKAWLAAWNTLDTEALRPLLEQANSGQAVELTLCGDAAAQTYSLQPQGLWANVRNRFATHDIAALLQSL